MKEEAEGTSQPHTHTHTRNLFIFVLELRNELNEQQNLSRRVSSLGAELSAKQQMIISIQRKSREEKVR